MLKWMWEEQSHCTLSLLIEQEEPSPSLLANPPGRAQAGFSQQAALCLQEPAQRQESGGVCPAVPAALAQEGCLLYPCLTQEKTARLWPAPI